MSNKETALERLDAADPALGLTEDELARSREKSLAVMHTDADQLTVGGSLGQFHQASSPRRFRVVAGVGLVAAAAAVVAGVAVSSVFAPAVEQAAPAATQPGIVQETGSASGPTPLPEITGLRMPTFDHHIVTGGNGNKAAVSNAPEADFHMDAMNGGKLGLNGAGCVVSTAPDGSEGGLIFPAGTEVTETGVVFPDGTALNIGDEFAFGGGLSNDPDRGECSPNGSPFLVQSWKPLP
jgi:hypothetical protein